MDLSQSRKPCKAILVCGLPGSGKTTYARELAAKIGGGVVTDTLESYNSTSRAASRDRRVEAALKAIEEGRVAVIDATGCNPAARKYWLHRLPQLGAVWMETPVDVCIARRGGGRWAKIVRSMHARMAQPSIDEGFVFVEVVRWDE